MSFVVVIKKIEIMIRIAILKVNSDAFTQCMVVNCNIVSTESSNKSNILFSVFSNEWQISTLLFFEKKMVPANSIKNKSLKCNLGIR